MEQLTLDLPNDYEASDGYIKAMEQYLKDVKRIDIAPVFLCYNKTNKTFFVSMFFSKEMVSNFARIIK